MRLIQQNRKLTFAALFATVAIGGLILAAQVYAGSHEADEAEAAEMAVGTYEPMVAFQSHPGFRELEEKGQAAQAEMQQAQETQDQEAMMRIHQQFQMDQQRIIEQFHNDLDQVMPKVAEREDVHVVAMEIVYSRPNVETRDVTEAVVAELAELVDEDEVETAPEPDFPWME